jgi:hypothetical protein
MIEGRYILFAWQSYNATGGFNDNRGLFETPSFALEFFNYSEDCKPFDCYQIVDIDTLSIISEGNK